MILMTVFQDSDKFSLCLRIKTEESRESDGYLNIKMFLLVISKWKKMFEK